MTTVLENVISSFISINETTELITKHIINVTINNSISPPNALKYLLFTSTFLIH